MALCTKKVSGPAPDKPSALKGKGTETRVTKALKAYREQGLLTFHRMPDAKAARGALSAQPADFIVSSPTCGPMWLEVKECREKYRLPKSKVSQYGSLVSFARMGLPACILVHRPLADGEDVWTVFASGEVCSTHWMDQASFPWDAGHTFDTLYRALEFILKRD